MIRILLPFTPLNSFATDIIKKRFGLVVMHNLWLFLRLSFTSTGLVSTVIFLLVLNSAVYLCFS